MKCGYCSGRGNVTSDYHVTIKCPRCNGTGVHPEPTANLDDVFRMVDDFGRGMRDAAKDPGSVSPHVLNWQRDDLRDAIRRLATPPAPPQFPTMLRKMWTGREVQAWIDEHWRL